MTSDATFKPDENVIEESLHSPLVGHAIQLHEYGAHWEKIANVLIVELSKQNRLLLNLACNASMLRDSVVVKLLEQDGGE